MHRKSCNSFFMVNMASSLNRRRVHPTRKNDDVAQHGSHTLANRLTETCSLGLYRTSLILDIHVMVNIDTCLNKVSADQYHMTI